MKNAGAQKRESERGQISLMVGLMMLTFLFLFCFVVNVGMLVNAKINLQNAADLAAYAGAATQARQLNSISYLNYEMRRQYKKFLFRYYIIGNMAQDSNPKTVSQSAGSTARQWKPTASHPEVDYKLPIVCVIFNSADNYCHVIKSPAISAPAQTNFDAINSALIQQLANIENVRQQNCQAIGATNRLILWLWLYNSDPTLQTLGQKLASSKQLPVITGLGQGLGLIPRELILYQRIQSLQSYVNGTPQQGVSYDGLSSFRNSADPSQYERTIQAYLSAYMTLGNHTFGDPTQIIMDELMPTASGGANLLQLNPITTTFDAYAMDYYLKQASTVGNPGAITINGKDCIPTAQLQQIKSGLVVGVSKNPSVLTYYAIRLTATAKVLFNPFGTDIQLKAYAAARPFGSRIGPPLQGSDFFRSGAVPGVSLTTNPEGGAATVINALQPLNQIPNLAIQVDEGTDVGHGWDSNEAQGTFFGTAFPSLTRGGIASQTSPIDSATISAAYQLAMAPNPEEEGFYNIPSDFPSNLGASWTHFAPMFDGQKQMALWAPIVPPAQGGSIDATLQNSLTELFLNAGSSSDPTGGQANENAFIEAIKSEISTYVNVTLQTAGEDGETTNTVRLRDPFFTQGSATTQPAQLTLPEWIMPNPTQDQKYILSSWNAPNDPKYQTEQATQGRGGYSVKFVTWSSVSGQTPTLASDQGESMNNPVSSEETGADIGAEMAH